MSKQGYHHGNLQEALIQAALNLIAEKGAGGFSFADAARSAGVSPAAPYRHFRDRDALLADVAERGGAPGCVSVDRDADGGPRAGRYDGVNNVELGKVIDHEIKHHRLFGRLEIVALGLEWREDRHRALREPSSRFRMRKGKPAMLAFLNAEDIPVPGLGRVRVPA